MSKLNSEVIKQTIAQYAETHLDGFEPRDLAKVKSAAKNPDLWKRVYKRKAANGFSDGDTIESVLEAVEWAEYTDVLDAEQVTGNCILRYFVNEKLAEMLDAFVITDPKDERILVIAWRSD